MVLAAFVDDPGAVETLSLIGDGNINDTYLVTFRGSPSIVVQRINQKVFPDPGCVADNVALVAGHLEKKLGQNSLEFGKIRFPHVVETIDGRNWLRDRHGAVWRGLAYIDATVSYPHLINEQQGIEVGKVLGCFHTLLADFDTSLLREPLPGFHDLQNYKDSYLSAVSTHRRWPGSAFDYCRKTIEDRLEEPSLNDHAHEVHAVTTVTHGDPKIENFLFDDGTGEAVSLIDLDTASTGLIAMDLGDCLRSLCNPAGEKGAQSAVYFDCPRGARLVAGYRQTAVLTEGDQVLIYHGVRMLTYELGLRFFTDYLMGDRYFKISCEDENLKRAVIQFTLLDSIEKQRSAIEAAAGLR